MNEIISLINKYAFVPVFVTVGYGLFIYKRLTGEIKTFFWFLFLSGVIQLISSALWFSSKNNLPLLHLYVAVGFVCLAWFYSAVLKDFINRKIIRGTTLLFIIFTLVNSIFFQNIYTYNSYALTVESILVIILSLFTYMVLLNDIVKEKRKNTIKSLNWINSGLFIYYTSSLLIFYFGEVIQTFSRDFNIYIGVLHTFFLLVMYSCFFVGLWKRPQN
jgi:hypothetical protein